MSEPDALALTMHTLPHVTAEAVQDSSLSSTDNGLFTASTPPYCKANCVEMLGARLHTRRVKQNKRCHLLYACMLDTS